MIPDEVKGMKPLTGKERLGAERDSKYMGAEDINPEIEPVLTIKAIYTGMVTLSKGKEKKDFIVFEEETVPGIKVVRPLIVNATNRKTLRKLYKSVNAETLTGKKIRLFLQHDVRDPSTGDKVDGIRIRPTVPTSAKPVTIPCDDCGKAITGTGNFSAEQIASASRQKYGKCLCVECGKKAKEALMAQSNSAQAPQTEGVQTARNDGATTVKTSAAQAAAEKNEAKAREEAIVHTEEPIRSDPGGTKEGQAESTQMSLAERLAAEMEVQ